MNPFITMNAVRAIPASPERWATARRATAWGLLAVLWAGLTRPASATVTVQIAKPDLFEKSQQAAETALDLYGIWDDPEQLERVSEIGYRLAGQSSFGGAPFAFYLIDMPVPNAFALPGGQIFLTRGMIELDLSDDMLAGLLGHEIGHVVLEHGTRMQRRANVFGILSQALLIGVILGASRNPDPHAPGYYDPYDPFGRRGDNSGDLVQGTAAASLVVGELLLRSYSRDFEDAADAEGQRLAAAAGYDPAGLGRLMDKMRTHLPETREYGYWRTHPFFADRVRTAATRSALLARQPTSEVSDYRRATQQVLLDWRKRNPRKEDPRLPPTPPTPDRRPAHGTTAREDYLVGAALAAWPQGEEAERIRRERLHAARDAIADQPATSRDLGRLIRRYESERDQIRRFTPESPAIAELDREIADFRKTLEERYPAATEILRKGIYETRFLEAFLSNYGTSEWAPGAALALADAYARTGRQTEAIEQYLAAAEADPEGEAGQKARRGLRTLVTRVDRLGALERLARNDKDEELERLARERLDKLAGEYQKLDNGAEYLRMFPDGTRADAVTGRLNRLADNAYGELLLYQQVGDHVRALERINAILEYAPESPAAEKLRERMVVEG